MVKHKLSLDRIEILKDLYTDLDKLIFELGNLEFTKLNIKYRKKEASQKFDSLKASEIRLLRELQEKYGAGQLDIENGIYIT